MHGSSLGVPKCTRTSSHNSMVCHNMLQRSAREAVQACQNFVDDPVVLTCKLCMMQSGHMGHLGHSMQHRI